MNIVIKPTVDDGSIRNAAILRTQEDLRCALVARSAQLNDVAWHTLVQTSCGVRTLGFLVTEALAYDDATIRLAALIEQSTRSGLLPVSAGLRHAALIGDPDLAG